MTEREALVAAVIAEPEDDLPRLVYADWLDEHGESERAEFIRVQIENPSWHCSFNNADGKPQIDTKLMNRHGYDWLGRWLYQNGGRYWGWRRGFIDEIAVSAEDWLAICDDLLPQHPVRKVHLTTPLEGNWWIGSGPTDTDSESATDFDVRVSPNPHETVFRYGGYDRAVTATDVRRQRRIGPAGVFTSAHIFRAFWPTVK
jgi:uncharacterized protein (TIGR02996 family)